MNAVLDEKSYYQNLSYEQAMEYVTNQITAPIMKPKYKDLHSEMLTEATRRNPAAREYVRTMMSKILDMGPYSVEGFSHEELVQALFQDMYGLGPIEPLINDPDVQEVNVNGCDNIWYEKQGKIYRAEGLSFGSNENLLRVIARCLPNKEVNMLDNFAQSNFANSRIYVGVPPIAKVPYLCYRKMTVFQADEESYLKSETLTEKALEVLKLFVRHKANITIIGPQGTGKTTLLAFLTDYMPEETRIGVLESGEFETDIEKRRPRGNVFSLRSDKKMNVTELDNFHNALRMSAKVLIIPEARGAEMDEVLKATRRGNNGSMTTLHSNGPRNLVDDMVLMIAESGKPYSLNLLKMMVAKALDIVITMHHMDDGSRKVIGISEIDYDDVNEKVVVNDLFEWDGEKLVRTAHTLREDLIYTLKFFKANPEELTKWGLIGGEQ